MQNEPFSRRTFLNSVSIAAPAILAANNLPLATNATNVSGKLKVVCVGGHPDDPESGCGGSLLRYAEAGHSVTIVYLTRGERGIRDKGLDEAAKIRTAECEAACKIIGAKPLFFGQIDGATEISKAHVETMTKLLSAEAPDIMFTHWSIDTH